MRSNNKNLIFIHIKASDSQEPNSKLRPTPLNNPKHNLELWYHLLKPWYYQEQTLDHKQPNKGTKAITRFGKIAYISVIEEKSIDD